MESGDDVSVVLWLPVGEEITDDSDVVADGPAVVLEEDETALQERS